MVTRLLCGGYDSVLHSGLPRGRAGTVDDLRRVVCLLRGGRQGGWFARLPLEGGGAVDTPPAIRQHDGWNARLHRGGGGGWFACLLRGRRQGGWCARLPH
ncbi:MAG: hypothetical protein LIO85_07395 [Rikenellaceae bacterium]|nr:hypothetical protein [Rikenellaceae bacterium]